MPRIKRTSHDSRIPKRDDPSRVNRRTGRLEIWRPKVESIGPDHVYSAYFGDLWLGSEPALIGGHAQRFGSIGRVYSFEAVPGGYVFLFNVDDPTDAVCVADLSTIPETPAKRAHALLTPLETALAGLGFHRSTQ